MSSLRARWGRQSDNGHCSPSLMEWTNPFALTEVYNTIHPAVCLSQVLDVQGFKHPGPQRLIEDNVGGDVTTLFHRNGHSSHARLLCDRLVVGTVSGNPGALLSNSWCSDMFC